MFPSQAEGREGSSSPGPGRRRVVVMMKSTPSSVSSRELRKSSHFRTAGYRSRISCCAALPTRRTLRGAALALGPSLVCNGALLRESRNNKCAGHAGVCIFDREHNNVAFASNHCEALTAESKTRVPLSRRSRSSRSLPSERSGTPSMAAYAEVFSHPQHLFLDAHDCAATSSSAQQSPSKLLSASDVSVDGVPLLSRCGSVLGKEGARWPASYHGSQHLDLAFYGCNAQHAAGSKLALLETGAKAQTSNRKSSGSTSRGSSGIASSSVTGTGTAPGKSDLPLTVSLLQTAEEGREEEDAAPTMVVFKAQGCKMFITFVGGVTSAVENLGNSTVRVKNCARTGHQMDQYGILVSGINCEAIDLKTPEQANVRTEGNFTLTQCQKTSVMQGPDDGTMGEPAATTAPGGGAGAGAKGAETPAVRPGAPDPALNPVTPPPVPAEEPAAGGAAAGSALDMGGDEDEDEELLAARRKQAVEPNQAAAVPPSAEAPAVVPAAAAAPSQVEPASGGAAAPSLAASAVQGGALAAAAAAPAKAAVSATSATAAGAAPPAATANREIAESELKKVVETAAAELLEKEKKVRAAVAATSGGAAAAEPMAETTPMSFLEVGESVTSATGIPATATSAHGDERK